MLVSVTILVVGLCVSTCSSEEVMRSVRQAVSGSYNPERSLLQFMLDMHHAEQQIQGDLDNIMFSPISIVNTLNLLLLGSQGETEQQLRTVLHYPDGLKQKLIHALFNDAVSRLLIPNRGVVMEMANGLFLDQTFQVDRDYLSTARAEYNASIETVNFKTDEPAARRRVNEFVSQKTKGRIPNMVTFPLTNAEMVIANALYFKGLWAMPFSPSLTFVDDFIVSNDVTIKVRMMTNIRELPYVEDQALGMTMVGLPYEGTPSHFGFFVILPDAEGVNGLKQLERSLTGEDLANLINRMEIHTVSLNLPKMNLEGSIDLRRTLESLGVTDVFDGSRSNLRLMSPASGLHVDTALHRANIVVNEKGSELAAATIATNTRVRVGKMMRVNRPFLFFIRDNYSGLPVFWARIVKPQDKEGPSAL